MEVLYEIYITKKIILSAILPLLLLGASIIIIAATIVKGSIISKVESPEGTAVATEAAYDQNAGSYLKAENGAIWKEATTYHSRRLWWTRLKRSPVWM